MPPTTLLVGLLVALGPAVAVAQDPAAPGGGAERPLQEVVGEANRALQGGDFARAVELYSQVIARSPDHGPAWLNRGNARRLLQQYEAALADFDAADRLLPGVSAVVVGRALANHGLGRSAAALTALRHWLDAHPKDLEVRILEVQLLCDYQKPKAALHELDELLKDQPGHGRLWQLRGIAYRGLRRRSEAIESFDRALQLQPNDVASLAHRAYVHCELRDWTKALADYDAAVQLAPNVPSVWILRAHCRLQVDVDGALADAKHAVSLAGDEPHTLAKLGDIQRLAGRFDDAIQSLRAARERLPADYSVQLSLAMTYHAKGDLQGALGRFRELSALDPKRAAGHYYVGQGLRKLKRWDEAIAAYEQCLALEPGPLLATARCAIADCLARKRKWAEARAMLAKARADAEARRAEDPEDHPRVYDLACVAAIASTCHGDRGEAGGKDAKAEVERAVGYLEEAVKLGMWDLMHIRTDEELAAVRNHPRYRRLVEGRQ